MGQSYWERLLNRQLFIPYFKVKIRFKKPYLNNDVKESLAKLQLMQYADTVYKAGLIKDDNPEWIQDMLQIPDRYRSEEKFKPSQDNVPKPGQPGGGPSATNRPEMQGNAVQKQRQIKKDEQNSRVKTTKK